MEEWVGGKNQQALIEKMACPIYPSHFSAQACAGKLEIG
jgi:hypothetical protein